MKKVLGLIFLVTVLVMLAGCQKIVEKKLESELNADVDIESSKSGGKVTIKGEDIDQEIEVKVGDKDSWCQEGSEWKSTGTEGTAKMVIEGIVSGGKYDGYCHVKYDINTEEGDANIDFYFTEDGDGYQVMKINGQTIETEYHS